MAEPVNLLQITEATVAGLMGNTQFLDAVPCLKAASIVGAQAKSGCGRCPRKRAAAANQTAANGLRCLAGLRGAKLAEVKALLGAKQLRFWVTNAQGSKVKYTL